MSIIHVRNSWNTIIVKDFDDTVYRNTDFLFNEYPWKIWFKWDKFHRELLRREWTEWVEAFHKKYQKWPIAQQVLWECSWWESFFLTAWIKKVQKRKIQDLWLWEFPIHVTDSWDLKTQRLARILRQKLSEQKPIPKEVIIFEDRPWNFDTVLLQNEFQIKFVLIKVNLWTWWPNLDIEV